MREPGTAPPYRSKLFRSIRLSHSFAGVVTPGLWGHILTSLRSVDLHHVHLGRDLTSLPAALLLSLLRRPFVVQPHGMVVRDDRLAVRILDRVATRRVLRAASAVFALNAAEAAELIALGSAPDRVRILPNGVELRDPGVVDVPAAVDVIFVGRLHPRKRVLSIVEAARLARDQGDRIDRFSIVGPDEGDLAEMLSTIETHELAGLVHYEGPMSSEAARARIASSSVLVMPSAEEPFGMVAIEALAAGVPIVVDYRAGVLGFLTASRAVIPTDGSDPAAIRSAVLACLDELPLRKAAAQEAIIASHLDIESIGRTLSETYSTIVSGHTSRARPRRPNESGTTSPA